MGDPAAVDAFLASEGLTGLDLGLPRLRSVMNAGSTAAQAGSQLASASGRWVKLSKESAKAIDQYGLRQSSKSGLSTGVLRGKSGQIKGFVEFAKTPGAALANPAVLAGVGGIMAQMAMQQAMNEITDYLAVIDEKVDDILRAQKDAVMSRMIGVGFVVDEAMALRQHRGRVDETTWSKVQASPATVAETQVYALRQLDALAEKMERHSKVGDLAKIAKDAESSAQEWLAVLARCVQLQDAIAILELDRVLDASPDELDGHRMGLRAAREDRLARISRTTQQLLDRMTSAAAVANTKVLLHPTTAPGVVHATNQVADAVVEFDRRLGLEHERQALEARTWTEAATDARDKALETGADGFDTAKRLGGQSVDRVKSVSGGFTNRITDRARRTRSSDDDAAAED
ncbi:hypothetical protein [Longivirga aurantiaca]|uniref:Uncharacterized protein n=1 Tax=Longivirga aurantiaca TaxID=1837743 RepID=A0ABW1T147_9ACTN